MTTPSTPQKRFLAAGAKKGSSTWGTAEALGAGFGMLIDSDGGLVRSQAYQPTNEADTTFPYEGDLGPVDPVDFSPEFFMRYDPSAIGVLIALLFGTAGSPSAIGNDVYSHTFQWATENDGEFATFCVERMSKIFEVQSAKPYSLDFSISDGFVRGTIGLRGNNLINTSAVNTATQIDALTYADRDNRMKFSQATIWMNDQSGGAVSSETALQVSDLSVHYERPMDGLHAAGSAGIIEPNQNGQSIVTATLNFPRMNAVNNAYFADFIAETEKKLRIKFAGAVAGSGGAVPFSMQLRFPRMRIINIDYPLEEIVPGAITLQAEEATSNPTGEDFPLPHIYLTNEATADYIA